MMRTARIMALIATFGLAGLAFAQPEEKKAPPSEDLLKGPAVRDNSIPGQNRKFGTGPADRRNAQRTPGMPVVARAINVLRGESAGEHRLTEDQDSRLKKVMSDFEAETRTYLQTHREEIARLVKSLPADERARVQRQIGEGRPARRGADRETERPASEPMMQEEMSAEDAAKARARVAEIFAGRPKPEDAQAKAWVVLNDSQKKLVQDEIARLQKEAESRMGKPAEPAKPGEMPKPGERANPADLAKQLEGKTPDEIMNDARVPEALRERLRNMSPEERARAVERFRERLRNGEGLPRRGQDKPAPKPDEVNVPKSPDSRR